MEKIKRAAPSIMSNDTYKRLYLRVLETCHDFKNKAKENIMESLKDDLMSEQARITEQEESVRIIEQKIGLDAVGKSTKVYAADTGEGFDFDDRICTTILNLLMVFLQKPLKFMTVDSADGFGPDKPVVNASVGEPATVVVSTNENSNVNVVAVEPGSMTMNDAGGVDNIFVVEDANVLEINPDALPDESKPMLPPLMTHQM